MRVSATNLAAYLRKGARPFDIRVRSDVNWVAKNTPKRETPGERFWK